MGRRVATFFLSRSCNLLLLVSWAFLLQSYVIQMETTHEAFETARKRQSWSLPATTTRKDKYLVEYGDSIYKIGDWEQAPVIIEKYKLVFFTTAKVGCTHWKQLFRRMMGIKDWKVEGTKALLPWNNELNGLKFLYDYDRETASHMMTSEEWTRAIIARDPKERFLSAYLDKAFHESFIRQKCCPYKGTCMKPARESPKGFLKLIQKCDNCHWRPQSSRMEAKYWPYINFVGHMETVEEDAKRLLQKLGAWEEYGASGWGEDGMQPVFHRQAGGRAHATGAQSKLTTHISPKLEVELNEFYRKDYDSPFLGLRELKIHS